MPEQVFSKINFDVRKSDKSYINSEEQFIVVYESVVYLRIVGEEKSYNILTATASEDGGKIIAFSDQDSLINAARKILLHYNVNPVIKYDYHQRPYVNIATCEYISDAHRVIEEFFANLRRVLHPDLAEYS